METNSRKVSLTEREAEAANLIASGYSCKEIADKLKISYDTANNHIRNIKEKNGITKNTEIPGLYVCYIKGKPFSLKTLREYGIMAMFIFLNVCTISNGGN